MNPDRKKIMQDEIKRLLENPPQLKFRSEKRKELIARLYEVEKERKSIVDFVPVRRLAPAFATVLATALLIFGYTYLFVPLEPVVFGARGNVTVYRSGEKRWVPAGDSKLKLGKNDIVKTAAASEVDIAIPALYHMRLKGNSEIRLSRTRSRALAGAIEYNLSRGRVFAYYRKGEGGKKPFEITTPEAAVSVTGTEFMVKTAQAAPKTWVGVLDGAVRVTAKDIRKGFLKPPEGRGSVLVEAGEKTVVRKGRIPDLPRRLLEDELLEMEELYRIGEKPQVALLISTGKSRVRELLSFTPLYIASEKDSVLPEKIKEIAPIFREAMLEGSKEKHIDTIRKFEEIVRTHPNPKYDVQFLLFIGAYYEYLDEDEKAIETFRKIIDEYPKSNLLSLARCAIGIIYEDKLEAAGEARLAYAKILSDYPRSPEVYEAEKGLERLTTKR
jgi:hypothetical protein